MFLLDYSYWGKCEWIKNLEFCDFDSRKENRAFNSLDQLRFEYNYRNCINKIHPIIVHKNYRLLIYCL